MLASAILLAVAVAAPANAPGTDRAAGTVDELLDNGLRVVLIPHRANPMVASAVVVGAGVAHEPPAASGASHFLEHLLFNGTTTRSQRQLYDDVDRLGAYNNATTREDHTLFTLLVARDLAEQGMAIQADMLFRSTIPEENFDKERKIVLEELARDRTDPAYDVEEAFRAFAFAGTPVGRPVLGTEASLGGISRSDVLAYYKARYVPANMTLVVMGDFEVSEMRGIVRRTFGAAPKAKAPARDAGAWPPPPAENVLRASSEQGPARLIAAFPFPCDPWERTAAAAEVLLEAASDGSDAPLKAGLDRRGVAATDVRVSLDRRVRPWTTVTLEAELPDEAAAEPVLDALAEAIGQTAQGGTARGRIDRVLAERRADAAVSRDQIHYFAMLRSPMVLGSPDGFLARDAQRFDRLDESDWGAASAALTAGLGQLRARLTGPGLVAGGAHWSPPAATAASSGPRRRAGTLANGLRYVVSASDDSDVFALHVAFAPRAASEPAGQDGITDLLHRVWLRGTTFESGAAIEDRLARLGARLKVVDDPSVPFDDYYTTPEFSWVRLEVPSAGWRESVALLSSILRAPAVSAPSVEESRKEMTTLATASGGSPRAVAQAKLDALLAPGDPMTRPVLGTPATLATIGPEALAAFAASTVVGSRMIVSAVGPVAPDAVVQALDADLGGLPPGEPARAAAPAPAGGEARHDEAVLGKSQAYVALAQLLDVPPGDRAALTVATSILSDRLAFALRETKGLAYSVGASTRPWAGRTRLDVSMGTRAANVDEARSGILEILEAFTSSPPSAADVARSINAVRGAALMRRMTRISLAYEAGLEALRGREPGDERRFIDALGDVTPDDVARVAKAYFRPERLSWVVVR